MNKHILAGLMCPSCQSESPFMIAYAGLAIFTDKGIVDSKEVQWGETSYCRCENCGLQKTVKEFALPAPIFVTHKERIDFLSLWDLISQDIYTDAREYRQRVKDINTLLKVLAPLAKKIEKGGKTNG